MKKTNALLATILLVSTAAHARLKPIPDSEITSSMNGGSEITSLQTLQSMGLNSGSSKIDLWSGSYWPQYEGLLAVRYRDADIAPLIQDPKAQFKLFKETTAKKPMYTFASTDNLSPAEKYDLYVGDSAMTLTNYSWALGDKTGKDSGKVPTWRGICDGFSSASQMMPRPRKSVSVVSPSGQPITFFPEDIKAIGSLSYSRSQNAPIFLGKRCLSGALFFTDACDETNPGAFHKTLTNRVGRQGKSFIADVSPGGEVWNYPVKSYSVSYYNVFNDENTSDDFRNVMESFDKKKKFTKKDRRDKRTAYIVGVELKVQYVDMRFPHTKSVDSTADDKIMEKVYDYDLELDYAFNILGGESASKNLPDFIWAPNDRTYPLSDVEEKSGVARSASEIAAQAQEASKLGQPLASVVKELFEASK